MSSQTVAHSKIGNCQKRSELPRMITGELKSKVDRIWNTMWSGRISNPLSVIEQLTYLLFIKGLDELHTRKERKAARTGNPIEEPVFAAHQDALRWSRFKELAPEQMFETVRDKVFPFIKSMGQTGDSEERSTYSHHMQDALFMMPTARVLANVVDQLDDIDMADRDTKGDLYEYMLGKIATAGQNGQFRTPRHIIKLMVDMTAPKPNDVICDPACGTAGFLVAASEYLVEHYGDRIYKDDKTRRRFNDMQADGYSLDDKRAPQSNTSYLADILTCWRNREAKRKRARTDQSFFVPKAEIEGNDYNLSINRYIHRRVAESNRRTTAFRPIRWPYAVWRGPSIQRIASPDPTVQS